MRVTNSMYYNNLFNQQNSALSTKLFDVNRQISSGLNIKYAQDDVRTFTETMRLDNEMVTLGQIKTSTQSGLKVSTQSDTVLNDFSTSLAQMNTLFINAANASHDNSSLDAIAKELRGIEDHFKHLANTSINGQYIFSGSAINTKPIADDGTYMGNDFALNALLGSNIQQQYNISGSELFLGEESGIRREVTTNVIQKNLSQMYPDYTNLELDGLDRNLTSEDTIRDMMGDLDNEVDDGVLKHHFYIQGIKSDGTSFNEHIKMSDDQSIETLLSEIGKAFGNTPDVDIVNVTMNSQGQIVVEDKKEGSSKIQFSMVGATDLNYDPAVGVDTADIDDPSYINGGLISNLDGGETDFSKIINGTSTAVNSGLHIKEFVKSPYQDSTGNVVNLDALNYDATQFEKDGAKLTSNISQVLKSDNSFVTPSTKISEVADLSKGTAGTLDGTSFRLAGTDVFGGTYDVMIDLKSAANGGSTFTMGGTTYDIFNMKDPRTAVDADEMTYQQLMDVVNMAATSQLPAGATDADYDKAISDSKSYGGTTITYDGKLEFEDITSQNTKASMALYDANSGDFNADASVMTFNSNNALQVRDAKTDFFKTIDEAIKAVEEHKVYPDVTTGELRNVGIQNGIAMIEDLEQHIYNAHSTVGANSNILQTSLERTETLEISTLTLRSSVIDTDLAEASLKLTQLSLNYEALLSTIGKVSKLSLVNYL